MTTLLLAWLAVAGADDQGATPPRVSIDVSALRRRTYDRISASEIYKGLLVRLVEEQIAVVDVGQPADITVVLKGSPGRMVRVEVASAVRSDAKDVDLDLTSPAGASLAITHALIEAIRGARDALLAARRASVPLVPPPELTALPPRRSRPPPTREVAMELRWPVPEHLAVAGVWSPGARGIAATVTGSFGALGPVLPSYSVGVERPVGVAGVLSIVEGWVALGLGLRQRLGQHFGASAHLLAGSWLHHFSFADGPQFNESGTRFDPLLTAQVGMSVALSAGVGLELTAGALAMPRERSHATRDATLWHASRVRAILGCGVGF